MPASWRGVQCQVAEATTTGGNGERRELRMETSVEVEVLVMMVAGWMGSYKIPSFEGLPRMTGVQAIVGEILACREEMGQR
jgi:hypothetical protein